MPGYAIGSLLPDYVLGGRLGALLTINLIAAWLLLELFLFTREVSKSWEAAFISWSLVGFTSPVFFFSTQVYPEIAGALVLLFALRRLLKPDFERKGLLVVIAIMALLSLKMRYAPIAIAIPILWAFLSHQRKRPLKILGTGVGIIGLVMITLLIDKALLGGLLIHKQFGDVEQILHDLMPKWENFSALFGLVFDQEFGLLFYSPLYAYGLIGIPYLLTQSRYRREALVITFPILIYIFPIISQHIHPWFGGWSLPSRYIVVITPLIGAMAAIIINERRGLITTILTRSLWIWGISIAFIMTLVTPWRYNSANGANILLRQIEEIFSTRITRFFPSFISPTQEGLIVFSGLLVFFIMIALLVLRQQPSSHISLKLGPWYQNLKTFAGGLVLLIVLGGLIIILGRSLPTRQLEAESMRHTTGIQYRDSTKNVWVLKENGTVWDYVILPENRKVFVNILSAGLCNTREAPRMIVKIGENKIGEIAILYGKDFWKDSYYTFEIYPTKGGMYPFSIELTNGLSNPRNERFCGLYVDRVEFRN